MNYIIITLSFIANMQLFAQKIKLDGNRLCVDNEYWGNLTEKRTNYGHNTLTFNGSDGKKWFDAQFVTIKLGDSTISLYKISFFPQNRDVYFKEGMELKNSLCAQLVKSGAITKTGTYDRGIDKFERNFGTLIPSQKEIRKIPNGKYKVNIVERDRNAAVFVSNGQIRQDFKLIGSYGEDVFTKSDTVFVRVFFLDINGVEIATSEFEKKNAETAILSINNYQETLIINLNPGTHEMKIQEIVQQLIYLKKI